MKRGPWRTPAPDASRRRWSRIPWRTIRPIVKGRPDERDRDYGRPARPGQRHPGRPPERVELSVRPRHGDALRVDLLPREALQRRSSPALLLRHPDLRLGALAALP